MSKGDELLHTKRAYRNLFVKKENPAGEHLLNHIQKLRHQALEEAETASVAGDTDKALACLNKAQAYKIVLGHIKIMSRDPRK